jgi:hypothetical protein
MLVLVMMGFIKCAVETDSDGLRQLYVSHIYSILLKTIYFALYTTPLSVQALQNWLCQVKIMLRPTISRPGCLGVKPHLGHKARFLLLSDSCAFVDVGRPLWWKDGSVVYNCCWPSPAQSFSGPSHVELATVFHCLRFETSLFVASYDSQGYGGSIRSRLHTGY